MKTKLLILVLLSSAVSFSQSNIVAAGHENYTVGEVFPIMQQDIKPKEVSLGVPTFELPEPPKPKPKPIKKQSFFEKIIALIKSLLK